MLETVQTQRFSLALALLAAAATAALSAIADVSLQVAVWRCIVAFAGVWVYQRLLVEAWTVLATEPARIRVQETGSRHRR